MQKANPINPIIYYPGYYMDKLIVVAEVAANHSCADCAVYSVCSFLADEVICKLGCSIEEANDLIEHLIPIGSLEQLLSEDENIFSDYGTFREEMENRYFIKDLKVRISRIFNLLRERERDVLIKRFGFYGGIAKTLEEIGNELGVTRERVRQIEQKALKRIRSLLT